jgi:hypothetical protein
MDELLENRKGYTASLAVLLITDRLMTASVFLRVGHVPNCVRACK